MVKISNNREDIIKEICVLNRIQKATNSNVDSEIRFPNVEAYGMVVCKNLSSGALDETDKIFDEKVSTRDVFGYYIMPQYKMSL